MPDRDEEDSPEDEEYYCDEPAEAIDDFSEDSHFFSLLL